MADLQRSRRGRVMKQRDGRLEGGLKKKILLISCDIKGIYIGINIFSKIISIV